MKTAYLQIAESKLSKASIDRIRAACDTLPGCPNLEGDVRKLGRIRAEAAALRAKADEMERRATQDFCEDLTADWSEAEILKAFDSL